MFILLNWTSSWQLPNPLDYTDTNSLRKWIYMGSLSMDLHEHLCEAMKPFNHHPVSERNWAWNPSPSCIYLCGVMYHIISWWLIHHLCPRRWFKADNGHQIGWYPKPCLAEDSSYLQRRRALRRTKHSEVAHVDQNVGNIFRAKT